MKRQLFFALSLILPSMVFTWTVASAQDPVAIYHDFLPTSALESGVYLDMIRTNLNQVAAIHPDLFYFFLQTVQIQFTDPGSNDATTALRSYNRMKHWYQDRRAAWATAQIDAIDSSNLDPDLKQRARGYFTELTVTSTSSQTSSCRWLSPIDTNKLNYFALLFLRPDTIIMFDPSVNYHIARNQIERSLSGILSHCEAMPPESFQNDADALFRSFPSVWHLLYRPLFDTSIDVTPACLVSDYVRRRYTFRTTPARFYIGAAYVPNRHFDIVYDFDFVSFKFPRWTRPVNLPQFAVFAVYRRTFKPTQASFAYVDIEAAFAIATTTNRSHPMLQLSSQQFASDAAGLQHEIDFSVNLDTADFAVHRMHTASLSVSTPLLFPIRNLALKAGGVIVLSRLQYSFTYSYYYSTTLDGSPYREGREKGSIIDTWEHELYFRPHLSLEYIGLDFLNLELLASFDYMAFKAGITILK